MEAGQTDRAMRRGAGASAASVLVSKMYASSRSSLWTPEQGCPQTGDCCVDVNAHEEAAGVTLQGFGCSDSAGWIRKQNLTSARNFQIQLAHMPSSGESTTGTFRFTSHFFILI